MTHACELAGLADAPAQPPQPGLRRMRVLFSVAEPVQEQRTPSGKGGEEEEGERNGQLGQLWSWPLPPIPPRTIETRPLFDVLPFTLLACPSWLSGSRSLVLCLSLLGPWGHFLAHTEFPGFLLPSETPPTPWSRRRAIRAWGRHSLTPPRPLLPGLLTRLLIAVLTCRIDWRPLWKRLQRPWPRSSLG